MKLTKEEKLRIRIRKEMIRDLFSQYDCFGLVTEESKKIWETEFKKRYDAKNK